MPRMVSLCTLTYYINASTILTDLHLHSLHRQGLAEQRTIYLLEVQKEVLSSKHITHSKDI